MSTKLYMGQLIKEAIVVTNVTAMPMETEGPICFDTPTNEHNPRNLERMKLLMKTVLIIMVM